MKSIINELWHGNIIPQEDSRTNSKEMKELLGYVGFEFVSVLAPAIVELLKRFFLFVCEAFL